MRLSDTGIKAVLLMGAEVVTQGRAVVVAVIQTAFLQKGHHLVHERIDAVFVDIYRHPEAIGRCGFEPLLQVIRCHSGWADRRGVVVDDAVSENVTEGPALESDLQGAR